MNQTLKTAFYRIAQDLKIKGDVAALINAFLNTETETPAPVEVPEEIKTEEVPIPIAEKSKQDDTISPDKARLAFQMFDEQMDTFKTSYDIIKKFLNQEFITDLWEEENDKLNEQVRQLNTKCESLEAELEATQKLLKAETKKLEASNARRKELAEKNIGAEQRIARLEEKNGELRTEVNQLKNTPRYAKVIPLSKLSQQPSIGPKLTSLLIDFLAIYDIKIDKRR